MSVACRPCPSQSLLSSLQSVSWQTVPGWASALTDFTYFGKQSKSFAPSNSLGPFRTCGWAEETQALPLSESRDLWSAAAPRLPRTSSLPSTTNVRRALPTPHLSLITHFPSLSLADNEVYECCLVSSICLGHQKIFPAVNGGTVTQLRPPARGGAGSPPPQLSAAGLLALCGKRNKESGHGDKMKGTDRLTGLSLSTGTQPGGSISGKAAVVTDGSDKPPPSAPLGPSGGAEGGGGSPSPQHGRPAPRARHLRTGAPPGSKQAARTPDVGGSEGILPTLVFSGEILS